MTLTNPSNKIIHCLDITKIITKDKNNLKRGKRLTQKTIKEVNKQKKQAIQIKEAVKK